jgi:hypothetical protein
MADYLLTRQPTRHAVKDSNKPADTATLRNEPLFVASHANLVTDPGRQCVAVAWTRSYVYLVAIRVLENLAARERGYLLMFTVGMMLLFCLSAGGASKAQALLIVDHSRQHPFVAGGSGGGGADGSDGRGSGGEATASPAVAMQQTMIYIYISSQKFTFSPQPIF